MAQAESLLKAIRSFMMAAPEELGILVSLWNASDEPAIPSHYRGAPILALLGCYTGPFEKGEFIVRSLRELGEPIADLGGPRPFAQVQTFLDADYPDGRLYYWKSACLRQLDDDIARILVEHADRRPSPLSSLDLWIVNGAMNQVPPEATAFAKRDAAYVLGIEANWTDPAQSDANIAWAKAVYDAVQPSKPGTTRTTSSKAS